MKLTARKLELLNKLRNFVFERSELKFLLCRNGDFRSILYSPGVFRSFCASKRTKI